MHVRQFVSRRSVAILASLVGMVSLAIGAHAALNKRALDAAKAIGTEQSADPTRKVSRLALVIGKLNRTVHLRVVSVRHYRRRPQTEGLSHVVHAE